LRPVPTSNLSYLLLGATRTLYLYPYLPLLLLLLLLLYIG
jgi:hypothetical protein